MFKIISWNINQRANYMKKDYIPPWVPEEINSLDADIAIITEFYKVSDWEKLVSTLASYNTFVTENPANEVLIAIKKKYPVESVQSWVSNYSDCLPDYLEVNIKHKQNIISVIGARILVDNYNYGIEDEVTKEMQCRRIQFDHILKKIKILQQKGNHIVGAGDLNTGRRGNPNKDWSMNVVEKELPSNIKLYTPDGCSHGLYKGDEFAGCPDHLFASSIMEVSNLSYNWEFAKTYEPNVYANGERTKMIPNPYPDHAILVAEIRNFNAL